VLWTVVLHIEKNLGCTAALAIATDVLT